MFVQIQVQADAALMKLGKEDDAHWKFGKEEEKVRELAEDFHTQIIGRLDRSELVMEAEEAGKVLLEYAPDSQMAEEYRKLADQILAVCGEERPC